MNTDISPELAIHFTIYCEDVRPELNGKWSILGVFGGDILVSEFPANLRLAFYCEAKVTGSFKGKLHTQVRLDDAMVAQVTGTMDAKQGVSAIPIPSMVIPFPNPGMIRVDFSVDGENWIEVASKEIKAGLVT